MEPTNYPITILRTKLFHDPDRLIFICDIQVGEFILRDFRLIRMLGANPGDILYWPAREIKKANSNQRTLIQLVNVNNARLKLAIENVVQQALEAELRGGSESKIFPEMGK